MASNLFAPPSPEELDALAAPPTPEELAALGAETPAAPSPVPQETEPGMLEAFARGGAQGLTGGFSDELTALGESALTDKTYDQALEESRANYKEAEEAHPITSIAGNVVGGIGLGGGLGVAGKALGATGKLSGLLGRLGANGLSPAAQKLATGVAAGTLEGAGMGALYGAGQAEGDVGRLEGATEGLTTGAVTGGALSGIGGAIGHGFQTARAADMVPDFVEDIAKSFEIGKKGQGLIARKSYQDIEQKGTQAAKDVVQLLDDELTQFGGIKDSILKQAAMENIHYNPTKMFDDALSKLDDIGFDPDAVNDKTLLANILNSFKKGYGGDDGIIAQASPDQMQKMRVSLARYTSRGDKPNVLQTKEGKQIVQSLVDGVNNLYRSGIPNEVAEKAMANMDDASKAAFQKFLAKTDENLPVVERIDQALSKLMTFKDALNITAKKGSAEEIKQMQGLRSAFGRIEEEGVSG